MYNDYLPAIPEYWKIFEISKFIDGWKQHHHQLENVAKIEKIYNDLIIKSIIE